MSAADTWAIASARAFCALVREPDLALGPDLDTTTLASPWRALTERYMVWLDEDGSGHDDAAGRPAAFLRSIPDEELPILGVGSRTRVMQRLQRALDGRPLGDGIEELARARQEHDDAHDADLLRNEPTPAGQQGYAVNDINAKSPQTGGTYRVNRVNRVHDEWPAPLAPAAFDGLAGEFVAVVEPETEADPAAVLIDLLVQVGHALGRTAHVRVGAVNHYPNLYGVVVGPSGAAGRKGTAYSEARRLLDRAAPEASARVVGGAASGEGIIWAVRDPIFARDKKTGEDVEVDPGVRDKRLLLREAEFSQVLRVAGRDSNTTSVVLREAWDGGERLQTLAKNNPATATGAHVSLLADITPAELRRELTATDRANGFANRILWCCSRRSKELPEGGRVDPGALDGLAARLGGLIADAHLLGPVARDDAARELWHGAYGSLTRERPGLLGALLARAEAQVTRLSLIYAVLDGAQTIGREHLEAALAVFDYCERSAAFIFGEALGDPTADELLDALRRAGTGMTRSELRDYFGRNRSSSEIGRALALLDGQGLARIERETTAGRPAERWYAVTTEGGPA